MNNFCDIRQYCDTSGVLYWSYCNYGHRDLARNWYAHFSASNPDLRPLVFVLDQRTGQYLESYGVRNVLFQSALSYSDHAIPYRSERGWTNLVAIKLEITRTLLLQGMSCFYTDTDVVILGNVKELINELVMTRDITFQENHRGSLCSGVFFANPAPSTIELIGNECLDRGEPLTNKGYHGDQSYLTERARKFSETLALGYFPKQEAPNGKTWYAMRLTRGRLLPLLIHYNCVIGNESKIAQMQIDGHWLG